MGLRGERKFGAGRVLSESGLDDAWNIYRAQWQGGKDDEGCSLALFKGCHDRPTAPNLSDQATKASPGLIGERTALG
jgi:hypothetical protein